jgi:hypothetical protein
MACRQQQVLLWQGTLNREYGEHVEEVRGHALMLVVLRAPPRIPATAECGTPRRSNCTKCSCRCHRCLHPDQA